MKTKKGYTVYTIATTLAEEVALVVIWFWVLPKLGISIPWWVLVLIMVALAAYTYITYRLCMRALYRKTLVGLETIIGSEGKATCRVAPKGYVRVQGELWKAVSKDAHVGEGEEIIVVGLDNNTLLVIPLCEENENM